MSNDASVRVLAPAKVNLWLEVLGRRDDGFHELESTLLALDRCDELELSLDAGLAPGAIRLDVDGPCASADVPRDVRNTVWRAVEMALAVAERHGAPATNGVAVRLEKHLPSEAGLGAGSSDAAAAVIGVMGLAGLDVETGGALERDLLVGLAAIGSDCPFFLAARSTGTGTVTGRGEDVRATASVGGPVFAILTPEARCSTASIYRALGAAPFDGRREGVDVPAADALLAGSLDQARTRLRNDLERAALAGEPALAAWRQLLDEHGGQHARLCGSGSSFFAMFAESDHAEAALAEWSTAAKARDLGLRAEFVTAPSGFGAHVVGSK